MNRAEYRRVAQARLVDARVLLQARRNDAAYYLAGYVVECALKACIARQFRSGNIPDKGSVDRLYTHNLGALAQSANLNRDIEAAANSDPQFGAHWQTVKSWKETSRYGVGRRAIEAQDMVDGVADPQHGVLQWLKQYW